MLLRIKDLLRGSTGRQNGEHRLHGIHPPHGFRRQQEPIYPIQNGIRDIGSFRAGRPGRVDHCIHDTGHDDRLGHQIAVGDNMLLGDGNFLGYHVQTEVTPEYKIK